MVVVAGVVAVAAEDGEEEASAGGGGSGEEGRDGSTKLQISEIATGEEGGAPSSRNTAATPSQVPAAGRVIPRLYVALATRSSTLGYFGVILNM